MRVALVVSSATVVADESGVLLLLLVLRSLSLWLPELLNRYCIWWGLSVSDANLVLRSLQFMPGNLWVMRGVGLELTGVCIVCFIMCWLQWVDGCCPYYYR